MMIRFTEYVVEQTTLAWSNANGWQVLPLTPLDNMVYTRLYFLA